MSELKFDRAQLQERLDRAPFNRFLGLQLTEVGPGTVTLRSSFREEMLATDGHYSHGGVIASLVDVGGVYAIITLYGRRAATIDLRVDYLRPARPGEDMLVRGQVVRLGKSVSLSDATVMHPDGEVIAIGRALYRTPAE